MLTTGQRLVHASVFATRKHASSKLRCAGRQQCFCCSPQCNSENSKIEVLFNAEGTVMLLDGRLWSFALTVYKALQSVCSLRCMINRGHIDATMHILVVDFGRRWHVAGSRLLVRPLYCRQVQRHLPLTRMAHMVPVIECMTYQSGTHSMVLLKDRQ